MELGTGLTLTIIREAAARLFPTKLPDEELVALYRAFEAACLRFFEEKPELGPPGESFLARDENVQKILHAFLTYATPELKPTDFNREGYADNDASVADVSEFLGILEEEVRATPITERHLALKRVVAKSLKPPRKRAAKTKLAGGTPLPDQGLETQEWLEEELRAVGLVGVERLPLSVAAMFDNEEPEGPGPYGYEWEHFRYLSPVSCVVERSEEHRGSVRALFTVLRGDLNASAFEDVYQVLRVQAVHMDLARDTRARNRPDDAHNKILAAELPSIGVCVVTGNVPRRQYKPMNRYRYETVTIRAGEAEGLLHYFPIGRITELPAIARKWEIINTNPFLLTSAQPTREGVVRKLADLKTLLESQLPSDVKFNLTE